jgi:hypothetical protein
MDMQWEFAGFMAKKAALSLNRFRVSVADF